MTNTLGFQHVGSFLRPDHLKQARQQYVAGSLAAADLRRVEDDAITTLVEQQVAAGLTCVTDGEFRRSYWHLDFFWGLTGVSHEHYGEGYQFAHEETRDDTAVLTGPIAFNPEHPFLADYAFVHAVAAQHGVPAKVTIPAPAQLLAELLRGKNAAAITRFYPDAAALSAAVSAAYRETILAFYALGARTVQLDDCTWGMLVDPKFWDTMAGAGFDGADLQVSYLTVNNQALVDLPADLTVTTHVCRGNYHSDWAASGGYDRVADALFGRENVAAYFLEYDSDRSGSFAPLAKVQGDKTVVLGLVTTKDAALEDEEALYQQVQAASQYRPLDQLAISTQCGFASTEEGNQLTEADQWAKLALVKRVYDRIWA